MSMTYFSGFGLRGEAPLFHSILAPYAHNPYAVAGFSYGAQKALEYVYASSKRVDTLLLLSPAWFLDRDEAFINAQIDALKANKTAYFRAFLRQAVFPCASQRLASYFTGATERQLRELLAYTWPKKKLSALCERGVRVVVYLGGKDRIINAYGAHDFFKAFAESRLIKEAGHILCERMENG